MDKKIKNWNIATLVFLSLALVYTSLRAYFLSMTHDEALTYIYFAYLPKSYMELIRYNIPTTNHHLLNSILIRFFTHHFGNSEFVIRLPALIGHALFLVGSYHTLKLFLKDRDLFIGAFLLALHPFLIDYFSCARGYSLALGFLMIGLYFCMRNIQSAETRGRTMMLSVAFLALAFSVVSNLAFLNVFVATVTVIGLWELFFIIQKKEGLLASLKQIFSRLAAPILPSSIFLYLLYAGPIVKLEKAKEFYHGGISGFWPDTFGSLVEVSLHGKSYAAPFVIIILQILICILVLAAIGHIIRKFLRKEVFNVKNRFMLFVVAELLVCSLAIAAQNKLLGTVYPIDRAVIYYLPLFTLLFLLLWQHAAEITHRTFRFGAKTFFSILITSAFFHFLTSINVSYFLLNRPDAHTKEMVETLMKMNEGKNLRPRSVHMGIHWWFEPAINYYILRNKIEWLEFVNRNGFDGLFDYYYVREDDKAVIQKYNLKVLKHYPISNTYFAEPNAS